MTKARGLKRGLKRSFFPPACGGGGTGREWEDSKMADALTSFSAKLSQASRKSTQLPVGRGREGGREGERH